MVECGICLEEYQEGDLELHREMCVVWMMFRCSLCGEDYVSKEGLWNHLDLHEIADESKELHYQEVKAKHKLHQCVLCNDQRAYLQSPYWKHIQDVHDGFFLRCSDCEETFRSEKLKNDHASSHCNARYQAVALDGNVLQEEQVPIKVENLTSNAERLKLLREEQRGNSNEGLDIRLSEHLRVNLNAANDAGSKIIDKESELPNSTLTYPKQAKEHDDSQFNAEETSLIHDVKEAKINSMVVLQDKNIELRLEIKVEEAMLQEQEDQAPNEVPGRSFDPTLTSANYVPVKTCSFEDAESFVKNFEFGFGLHSKNNNKNGSNRYYRCTHLKTKVRPQCKRKVWMFTPNENEKSTVCAKGEHSCINAPPESLAVEVDNSYVPVKTCSFEDAKSFVKNFEFGFGFTAKQDCQKGNMRYYRCTRVKHSARPQCERKVLICTPNINEKSTVSAKGEHSCKNAPPENLAVHAQIDLAYVPVKTCSFEDAELFVKNFEFGFCLHSKNNNKNGSNRYYRCTRLKKRVRPQCKRIVWLFTPNKNEKTTVCAKGEHSCTNVPPENLAVQPQVDNGYVPVKTCSFEDAKSFVKNFEYGFGFNVKQDCEKGIMRYYRCTRVKHRARPQCERKVLICTPNINEKSTVSAKGEHSCLNAPPANLTVTAQIDLGYVPVKTCSLEDAKSFVKNFEFGFACLLETDRGIGKTRHYRCTRVGRSVRPQCERKVLIFTPDVNEESMVCATGEHSCINAPPENLTAHPQIGLGYVPIETCSLEDAKLFVKNFELGFGFIAENDRNMRYYRCTRVKSKARPQCERKVLIFTPSTNEKSMVCAKGEHSCMHAPPENLTRAKPSVEQADFIQKLLKAGVPKKDVKDHTTLLEAGDSKKQLDHSVTNASKRLDPQAEPKYKCSFCPRMFDSARSHRRHEKSCSDLQCNKCSVKFTTRRQLNNHYKRKHPHDRKSKDVQAEDAEDLDNTLKFTDEYPEDERIVAAQPNTVESAECHEVPSDRIVPLVRHEVMDVH